MSDNEKPAQETGQASDLASLYASADMASEETTFTIRGTTFSISKLLAMEAYDVLEDIREALGASSKGLDELDLQSDGGAITAIVKTILRLPKANTDLIRRKLFAHISFTNASVATPIPLHGSEDMAFEGLEAFHIYVVFGRALLVNFFKSFEGVASNMTQAPTSPPPSTQT